MMTYGGGPAGGYIIDYSSTPRAVSRWHQRLGDMRITPLPEGVGLLYKDIPDDTPSEHVREFTTEEVESLEFQWLDYVYATELFEDIWQDVPGETPDDPANLPGNFGFVEFEYDGQNWQDFEAHDTITVTERRFLSAKLRLLPTKLCPWTG
ncbi:MAG: hypothetical protein ACKPKO_11855, partial [Candidatus Fonsibacter sp.]